MCLKWVYPSLSVSNLVAYLSATVAQSGGVDLISIIFLSHSLGAVGGVRLFLENSSVSCLTVVLSSGAPISPNEYSLVVRIIYVCVGLPIVLLGLGSL
jgi:hypothetical protein